MDGGYTETLISWYRNDSHKGGLNLADVIETGYNPKCGDRITIYIQGDQNGITDISFVPEACMLCTASAEAAVQSLIKYSGTPTQLAADMSHMLKNKFDGSTFPDVEGVLMETLSHYPVRQTCLTLPWETIIKGLQKLPGNNIE